MRNCRPDTSMAHNSYAPLQLCACTQLSAAKRICCNFLGVIYSKPPPCRSLLRYFTSQKYTVPRRAPVTGDDRASLASEEVSSHRLGPTANLGGGHAYAWMGLKLRRCNIHSPCSCIAARCSAVPYPTCVSKP